MDMSAVVGYLTLSCPVQYRNCLLLSGSEDEFLCWMPIIVECHSDGCNTTWCVHNWCGSTTFGQRKIHKNWEAIAYMKCSTQWTALNCEATKSLLLEKYLRVPTREWQVHCTFKMNLRDSKLSLIGYVEWRTDMILRSMRYASWTYQQWLEWLMIMRSPFSWKWVNVNSCTLIHLKNATITPCDVCMIDDWIKTSIKYWLSRNEHMICSAMLICATSLTWRLPSMLCNRATSIHRMSTMKYVMEWHPIALSCMWHVKVNANCEYLSNRYAMNQPRWFGFE